MEDEQRTKKLLLRKLTELRSQNAELEKSISGSMSADLTIDFEISHDFQDIGHKVMLLNAREIYRKDMGTKVLLLAFEDITEHKRLEDLLADSGSSFILGGSDGPDIQLFKEVIACLDVRP
ncbi:MAG: hypothetical protein R6U55_01615 [Desulfovermiculus sp.]